MSVRITQSVDARRCATAQCPDECAEVTLGNIISIAKAPSIAVSGHSAAVRKVEVDAMARLPAAGYVARWTFVVVRTGNRNRKPGTGPHAIVGYLYVQVVQLISNQGFNFRHAYLFLME